MDLQEITQKDIILVDKPSGITSFDVIRRLRRILGIKKMGHAGTLDPLATGLLIIGINKGTKRLTEFLKLPKVYEATIKLGTKTDSADIDGNILAEKETPLLDQKQIVSALDSMKGTLNIPVPIYSAIKRNGKPLYEYARSNQKIEIPVKEMTVTDYELLSSEHPYISVRWSVSSGTYIRSLAEELATRLNTIGTISALRRISIGEFSLEKIDIPQEELLTK